MRRGFVSLAKRGVVWLVAVAVVLATLVVAWGANPLGPRPGTVGTATEETGVEVVERKDVYVVRDGDYPPARTAIVFYPGARVDPRSYVPTLAPLVERTGVRVYIPKVPLHFAIFDPDVAIPWRVDPIQKRPRNVQEWYVGGHSLGGAMACRYASNHPDRVEGVVLYGSFCNADLSNTDLAALQVVGTRDAVLDQGSVDRNRGNLPADATVRRLDGVNHSQFGSYTGQTEDRPGTVSYARAHERIEAVTRTWLTNRTTPEGGAREPTGEEAVGGDGLAGAAATARDAP